KNISQVEGKPCNKSTLLHNTRYKAKLLTYEARSLAPGTKPLNSRTVTDPTTKALITSAQLESGNLKRELERLNFYVRSLEEQVDRPHSQGRQLPSTADIGGAATPLTDHEFRFIRTCQALRLLLNHLHMVVQVDPSNQR